MCGILATSRITNITRQMLPILAWEMKKRGTDAWGASDGTDIIKKSGSITDSYELPDHWSRVIMHTRAGTHGDKSDPANAHPFEFTRERDGFKIIGVHNGIIRSHYELNRQYDRKFEVDSQHVYAHLIDELPLKEIEGYGALVWWEGWPPYNDMQMRLAKFNHYDLHAVTLESGELVICSKSDPITESAPMFGGKVKATYKLEDNIKYHVQTDDSGLDVVTRGIELPFGARGVINQSQYQRTVGGGGHSSYTPGSYMYGHAHQRYLVDDDSDDVGTVDLWKRAAQRDSVHQNRSSEVNGNSNFSADRTWVDCFQCGRVQVNSKEALLCQMCLKSELEVFCGKTNGNN